MTFIIRIETAACLPVTTGAAAMRGGDEMEGKLFTYIKYS